MNIDSVVNEVIEQVRDKRSLTHDAPALLRVLANYPDHEPAAIAARAHEAWSDAIKAGDMDRAQGLTLVANIVYAAAGDEANSIRAAYDFGQTRFMLANDVEAYTSQRQQMITLCERAMALGIEDVAFGAAVMVADCTFFAAECAPDLQHRDVILNAMIGDLVSTCGVLRACKTRPATSSVNFQRFVSLAANAYARIKQRLQMIPLPFFADADGGYDEELATRMRTLAAALEEFVPDDFVFGENAEKSAQVSRSLAELSKDSGSHERARSRLRALLMNGRASRQLEREKLCSLFDLYEMERDAPGARDGLGELRQLAVDRINRLRLACRSRTGRLEAVEFVDRNIASLLEDALAQESDPGKLFDLIEGLKARTLLDQMRTRPPEAPSPETARRIDALERKIMSFNPAAEVPHGFMRALQLASQLHIAHPEHIDEVENLLAASDAGFNEGAAAVSLADVSAALRADEVLIEYCMPSRAMGAARLPLAVWALVITRQSSRVVPLVRFPPPGSLESRVEIDGEAGVDFSPITSVTSKLTSAIRAGVSNTDEQLNEAYELLISPLLAAGLDPSVHRHWIIVPDAALHMVPFAALRDAEGQYLGVKIAMTLVPSASVWHHQQQAVPQIARFLGFGNPQVPGLEALPFAENELREASRLLRNRGIDCKVFLGADATESRLKEIVVGHHILHIAAHGAIATADAFDFHDLMLASTGADDGRLHAHELRTLDLRETSLAVLSVCDSGTYRFGAGNELHGLVASLLIAGVHDVLGTLWPIDDALASRIIVRFYTYLLQHGAAEALRRARADLIGQGAQVVDWASFLIVGHGRGAHPATAQRVEVLPARFS